MAYGSQLFALGNAARQRGFQGAESGLERLMAASQQASQQSFAAREAQKEREFRDEQRKKQEKAQRKAMWTSLGLNAGTAAVGGAITGGLAAGEGAGIAAPAIDTSVSMGIPAAVEASAPALANAPQSLAASSPSFAPSMPAAMFKPFAGGSIGRGAVLGGALGGLGALGGQNYLGTVLAMPGQNYRLAADAFETANQQALQWAQFGQREKKTKEDNTARIEAAKMSNDARRYVSDNSLDGSMYRNETSRANNVASNQTREGIAGLNRAQKQSQFNDLLPIRRGMMDIRGADSAERGRHNLITERQGERRTGAYERGYGSGNGQGMSPTISIGPNGPSVSGKNLSRVQETYNQVSTTAGYKDAQERVRAHAFNNDDPGNVDATLKYMVKEGKISEEEYKRLKAWAGY